MSDVHDGQQQREDLPRDGQDTGDGPPVRDRPGDAASDGMRVSGPGEVSPAPEGPSEAPDQDPVVEERRRHVVQAHGGDGTGPPRPGSSGTGS
jgi:hypothetical protein